MQGRARGDGTGQHRCTARNVRGIWRVDWSMDTVAAESSICTPSCSVTQGHLPHNSGDKKTGILTFTHIVLLFYVLTSVLPASQNRYIGRALFA